MNENTFPLPARLSQERSRVRLISFFDEKVKYSDLKGDYSQDYNYLISWRDLDKGDHGELFKKRNSIDELRGIEFFLSERIKELLKKKKEPIILTDLGGMAGLSWIRLAKHFENEIKTGRIAFVVTNLTFDPEKDIDNIGLSEMEKIFFKENNRLVNFVKSPIGRLSRMAVSLYNGQSINLRRNIDILFEKKSVTAWSKAPEVDILRVSSLLSDVGTYFVSEEDTRVIFSEPGSQRSEKDMRIRGIRLAHSQLTEKYGLQRVDFIENGKHKDKKMSYLAFKREKSPKISL